jgi:hypothetical protein
MHEAAPVIIEQHRNRKSVPDCDAIQKNPERCKKLTVATPQISSTVVPASAAVCTTAALAAEASRDGERPAFLL